MEKKIFSSIFTKKRNSRVHFKYIKNLEIIHRNPCFGVVEMFILWGKHFNDEFSVNWTNVKINDLIYSVSPFSSKATNPI